MPTGTALEDDANAAPTLDHDVPSLGRDQKGAIPLGLRNHLQRNVFIPHLPIIGRLTPPIEGVDSPLRVVLRFTCRGLRDRRVLLRNAAPPRTTQAETRTRPSPITVRFATTQLGRPLTL